MVYGAELISEAGQKRTETQTFSISDREGYFEGHYIERDTSLKV